MAATIRIIELERIYGNANNRQEWDYRVVSALHARANFGKLLRRVEDERRSLVIGKAGHSQGGAARHPGLCAAGRP